MFEPIPVGIEEWYSVISPTLMNKDHGAYGKLRGYLVFVFWPYFSVFLNRNNGKMFG